MYIHTYIYHLYRTTTTAITPRIPKLYKKINVESAINCKQKSQTDFYRKKCILIVKLKILKNNQQKKKRKNCID